MSSIDLISPPTPVRWCAKCKTAPPPIHAIRNCLKRERALSAVFQAAGMPLSNKESATSLTQKWRATADEDGHYCCAVAL
jgi:hypothetical protein